MRCISDSPSLTKFYIVTPVSYTHLDVYKRQRVYKVFGWDGMLLSIWVGERISASEVLSLAKVWCVV